MGKTRPYGLPGAILGYRKQVGVKTNPRREEGNSDHTATYWRTPDPLFHPSGDILVGS